MAQISAKSFLVVVPFLKSLIFAQNSIHMGIVHSPISEYVLMSKEEREQHLNPILKSLFDKLKDEIKEHLVLEEDKGLPDVLLENLFLIRLKMVEILQSDQSLFDKMEHQMVKEASFRYEVQGRLSKLSETMANVIEVYGEILSSLKHKIKQPPMGLPVINYAEKPTLRGLRGLCVLHPSPELKHYLDWVTASLSFEYYLVAADMKLSATMVLSNEEASLLARKLRESFELFAAHTSLSGLWEPAIEDERLLVQNINIVIGILEIETEKSNLHTDWQMYDLTHSLD